MWWKNRKIQVVFGVVIVVLVSVGLWYDTQVSAHTYAIEVCAETHHDDLTRRLDCWYSVLRDVFNAHGTQSAFDTFEYIYNTYPDFSDTGCHRHAHRVGDMAYYLDYLQHRELLEVEFPKNASTCGYGFYHGFFEHLTQDIPDVDFVTRVCTLVEEELFEEAPAIQQTCYHGSGHGFVLSIVDELIQSEDWSFQVFAQKPLALCDALPEATDRERSECRQGVFNVLADWMDDHEYGLAHTPDDPFKMCRIQKEEHQRDCYYELAQKIDSFSGRSVVRAAEIASTIPSIKTQRVAMIVGIAGIVQHSPTADQESLLQECLSIGKASMASACVEGIVGGLVEHGVTGEYSNPIQLCELVILDSDMRKVCYQTLREKLLRFETQANIDDMCATQILTARFCDFMTSNQDH